MKVLVYPHDLAMGGSQLNAIEIAAEIHRLGHTTSVFGNPGPLCARVRELGMEFIPCPSGRRPSRRVIETLLAAVDELEIDVVHGYEWPPALDCFIAGFMRPGVTVIGTVMSMAVAPFLPKSLPIVVGTEQIAAVEKMNGRKGVAVLEPPVDLTSNRIEAPDVDLRGFKQTWHIDDNVPVVVCVARLHEFKLDALRNAIGAIDQVAAKVPIRLVVVGGGPARGVVEELAADVNGRRGDRTVVLTGELADPRAAYAAADVSLGMGSSALRAMAFSKPLIVDGEKGFVRLLTPESLNEFLWHGWYGVGTDKSTGVAQLADILEGLLRDPGYRARLGMFGRLVVEQRFSLADAGRRQLDLYEWAGEQVMQTRRSQLASALPASSSFARYHLRRRRAWARGRTAQDFNVMPVARTHAAMPVPAGLSSSLGFTRG